MKIVNCTPHTINFIDNGRNIAFPASGIIPRVSVIETPAENLFTCSPECEKGLSGKCGFQDTDFFCERIVLPTKTQKTGEVEGLPEMEDNTFYIVSGMVFTATDRPDVIAPDTGKSAIRNFAGQIEAVTRFIRK